MSRIVYKGVRTPDQPGGATVWVLKRGLDGDELRRDLLPHYLSECNHSPTGFQWGYHGSGPAQLAYALVRHLTGSREKAWRLHQLLKRALVGNLKDDIWELEQAALSQIVERIESK